MKKYAIYLRNDIRHTHRQEVLLGYSDNHLPYDLNIEFKLYNHIKIDRVTATTYYDYNGKLYDEVVAIENEDKSL